MSGQALCDICVSVCVCAHSQEHIRYPHSPQAEKAASLTCVLAGHSHYIFFFLAGRVAGFHLTSALISMMCVRAARTWCDLWQMPHECSSTCRSKHSRSCWCLCARCINSHHFQEDIHRELEGFRITDELFILNEHKKTHFVLFAD